MAVEVLPPCALAVELGRHEGLELLILGQDGSRDHGRPGVDLRLAIDRLRGGRRGDHLRSGSRAQSRPLAGREEAREDLLDLLDVGLEVADNLTIGLAQRHEPILAREVDVGVETSELGDGLRDDERRTRLVSALEPKEAPARILLQARLRAGVEADRMETHALARGEELGDEGLGGRKGNLGDSGHGLDRFLRDLFPGLVR